MVLYLWVPFVITTYLTGIFAPSIENIEQARKYLSNTTWNTSTSSPNSFEGETDLLRHSQKYHFSENAETCYGEFKIDYRLNRGESTEYVAGDEHSVEISEKEYFVNKYGGDTKEFYFDSKNSFVFSLI